MTFYEQLDKIDEVLEETNKRVEPSKLAKDIANAMFHEAFVAAEEDE